MIVQNKTHSVETVHWILTFDFFGRFEIWGAILSGGTGQGQQDTDPSKPCVHEGKQLIPLRLFCT